MSYFVDLLNSSAARWWLFLFHATWQSALVALMVLILLVVGKRWPSPLRYGLLVVALLKFAMPPLLSIPTGVFHFAGPVVTPPVVYQFEAESVLTIPFSTEANLLDGPPPIDINTDPEQHQATALTDQSEFEIAMMIPDLSWQAWLMLTHCMGALLAASWMLFHIWRLSRMIRRGQVIQEGPLYQCFNELCAALGIRRIPKLIVVNVECAPSAFGLLRPVVIVPASLMSRASMDSMRTVLAHELAHFHRWDLWTNCVQLILFIPWWFNPVYWLLSKNLRQVREDCCDDLLIAKGIVNGEGYCETLLEVARRIRTATPIGAALGFSERVHPLGRRLRRLLDPDLQRVSGLSLSSLITIVVLSVLLLPGLRGTAEQKDGSDTPAAPNETFSTISTVNPGTAPSRRTMTLHVLSEDGTTPLSCSVSINTSSGCGFYQSDSQELSTGDSGMTQFEYPEFKIGYLIIKAHKPGYTNEDISWVNTPSVEFPADCTLKMEKGKTIGGQVTNEEGEGVAGVKVNMLAVNSKINDHEEGVPYTSMASDVPVITDLDGHWSADNVPKDADKVELRLSHTDYVSDWEFGDSGSFPLEDLLSQKAVSVLKRGITMEGTVLDMQGQPIMNARVSQSSNKCSSVNPRMKTGSDGRFEFKHSRPGETILTIQAGGYAPELMKLTLTQETPPRTYYLEAGKTIRGKIVDVNGKPVAGAEIGINSWRGYRSLQWEEKTKEDGTFRWIEAPSDEVAMYVSREGYMSISQPMKPSDKENVITLKKALRIKGNVVDADTGQPIEGFSISQGIFFEGRTQPTWISTRDQYVSGNHFETIFTVPYKAYCIRVNKAGYLPGISPSITGNEEEVSFEIRLNKGVNPSGILKDIDGKPIKGMDVYLLTPANPIFFQNGKIVSGLNGLTPVKTDDQGRFEFIPQIDPFKILAVNDMGYVEVSDEGLKANPEVIFRPWGKVTGELRAGKTPGAAGERIILSFLLDPSGYEKPGIHFLYNTDTDSEGRFVFNYVKTGDALVSWKMKAGLDSDTFCYGESIEVQAGETDHVTLGGYGLPVTGKIVVPATATEPIPFQKYRSCLRKQMPDPIDSKLLEGKSIEEQKKFWDEWPKSEANRQYRKNYDHHRNFKFPIQEDGSFIAWDIPSGTYTLSIGIYAGNTNQSDEEQPIASIHKVVIIPEMPEGKSDVPFDLGELPLTILK